MRLKKEVRIGVVVAIGIAVFIYGFNFLKGSDLFENQRTFYAIYRDIDGLIENNPVQLNGFKIGRVSNIEIYPGNMEKILVTLSISEKDAQIPKNTTARIVSSDILGSKAIQIYIGSSPDMAEEGDTLLADIQESLSQAVNKQVQPIREKALELLASIDSVTIVIRNVFNKDAREDLGKSFESIRNAIATFEKTAVRIDNLMESEKEKLSSIFSKIESITTTIEKNNENLSQAMGNLKSITDSIAKSNLTSTINNTNRALANAADIMEKINKGEGSAGLLVNDKKLYNDLNAASASLNRLLEDMKKYPGRYFSIFGKKDKPPKGAALAPGS